MTNRSSRDVMIALSLLPFLTPNRVRLLLESFDPVETACNAASTLLETLLRIDAGQAAELKAAARNASGPDVAALRHSTVTLTDPAFPPLLREIHDPPLVLHFRGDAGLLNRPAVAIVGSRRASPYAINVAAHLGRQIAAAGLTVVSGLASGVDAAAHEAALDAGGTTVAVLGTGIDVIYPRSNARLFSRIEQHGTIITEFPPGCPPRRENFPIRNRLISGLCRGTVIVEATRRSGSLITARLAAEQGREVFAVPGSIFSPGSEGTHRLIQYGAKLVHEVADIFDELPADLRPAASSQQPELAPAGGYRNVLSALNAEEGTHVDDLAAKLGCPAGTIAESLLELELGGWIRALPGARYVRCR